MGFLELLTLVFVALKLMGFIDWGWVAVMSPMLFALLMYLIMFIVLLVMTYKTGTNPIRNLRKKR